MSVVLLCDAPDCQNAIVTTLDSTNSVRPPRPWWINSGAVACSVACLAKTEKNRPS